MTEKLSELSLEQYYSAIKNQDSTILNKDLFQSKPQYISEELMRSTFEIVKGVVEVIGTNWFEADPTLLCLIAHLNTVQTRICLDVPERIKIKDLITCSTIGEICIRCVDYADFLEDDKATILAKAVRDTACYIFEFWGEAKEQGVAIEPEVHLVLYRFVCVFLTIGGSQLLNTSILNKCSNSLLEVCQQAICNNDSSTAYLLLPYLNQLPTLTVDTIHLIVEFVMKQFPDGNWHDAVEDALECIEKLKFRVDWYSAQTLLAARSKLDFLPDKRLIDILDM
uniref:PRD domain-containing protein n=1 Tax=Heterorhabditis bacteriophora TaxID=37862 RepID=A0A1I7XUN2_HETBA